jgi:hypothetical protein
VSPLAIVLTLRFKIGEEAAGSCLLSDRHMEQPELKIPIVVRYLGFIPGERYIQPTTHFNLPATAYAHVSQVNIEIDERAMEIALILQ